MTIRASSLGLMMLSAFVLLAGCAQAPSPTQTNRAIALIPADAAVVFSIDKPESLYSRIDLDRLLAMGEASNNGFARYLNLDTLRARGLDTASPILIALLTQNPQTFFAALPGDGAVLSRSLREILADGSQDVSTVATHDGIEILGADGVPVVFFDMNDFLVLAGSGEPDSIAAVTVAQRLLDMETGRALSRSSDFRTVSAKLSTDRDLFFYARVDSAEQTDKLKAELAEGKGVSPAWFRFMDAVAGLSSGIRGVGGTVSFVPNGLAGDSFMLMESGSTVLAFLQPSTTSDPFARRVPGTPRVIFGSNMDTQAMWSWIRSNLLDEIADASTEYAKIEAGVREELGIELEHDLIKQIMGNGMLIINHVGMVGTDVVLYFQIARPADFAETVTKIAGVAKAKTSAGQGTVSFEEDEEAGVKFHRITVMPFAVLCAGIIDDHFVLTTTRARFADIVHGKSGLADEVDYPALADALEGTPGSLFYLDLGLLTDLLNMFAGFMSSGQQGGAQVAGAALDSLQLSHVLSVSNVERGGYRTMLQIESDRDDFWKALVDLIMGVTP